MKDEIQSRRRFFKNVARTVLPILGCLALPRPIQAAISEVSNNPQIPQTCGGSCTGLCTTTCFNGCKNGCKGCKGSCEMVALRHAAVDVGKDVVDPVEMDAPHHVTMFAEMIAFLHVQELAELDVRATVSSDAAATAMVTVLAHVKADVVMVALVVLFKYLALVFIFDVTH